MRVSRTEMNGRSQAGIVTPLEGWPVPSLSLLPPLQGRWGHPSSPREGQGRGRAPHPTQAHLGTTRTALLLQELSACPEPAVPTLRGLKETGPALQCHGQYLPVGIKHAELPQP